MTRHRIMVVEDDAPIRQGLVDALRYGGYDTLEAAEFGAARRLAVQEPYDLLLLDLVLPKGDGLDILQQVRLGRPTLPVIILTARGEESDRVRGLKLGADDYVVKPFSVQELLARVEAVLRRSPERPLDRHEVRFPDGVADLDRRQVRYHDGGQAELAEREADLLRYLANNPSRPVSRDEILTHVWRVPPRAVSATRTIDVHVSRLREKLRDDRVSPRLIVTVRGKGYQLVVPEVGP
jgi:DNA-binding response OmpR family regulator